jgi:putative two-component system response regulator
MNKQILVVDDMDINRDLLAEMLEDDYDVLQAADGAAAIQAIREHKETLCAILLDLVMPQVDGFGVLEDMNANKLIEKMPVLVISGATDKDVERKCFDMGVSDFIQKPFNEAVVKRRMRNIINLYSYQNRLEEKVEQQTEILMKQNRLLKQQTAQLRENNVRIIDILGNVVESRNLESGEHIKRVKGFSRILGYQFMKDYPEYGLSETRVQMISEASALHDIGKIAIPDNVLLKPGRLTTEEFELMKSHTTRGCDILNGIEGIWEEDYRKTSYEICRHHHERYDGKGYPDHLKGEDIPISAQIVSVADVYDALVSERVYKDAYSKEEAFHMIINGECGVFSPKLLESFRHARLAFEKLADNNDNAES